MTRVVGEGVDLFKIATCTISGWIPRFKTDNSGHIRQPFCSQLEDRFPLYLEYCLQVVWYARGSVGPQFVTTYQLPIPKDSPFVNDYVFDGKPHDYLPKSATILLLFCATGQWLQSIHLPGEAPS